MSFAEKEITSLTETIWLSTLGLAVERIAELPPEVSRQRTLMGCVHISGEWQGAVVLHCPMPLAQRLAQIMFSLNGQAPTLEDTQDALGEITNMTGGNIKALLPEPCSLSLPAIVEGEDYTLRVPGTCLVSRLVFQCQDAAFVVSLLQKDLTPAKRK
jgi:CheY-specific phosphatase CheX